MNSDQAITTPAPATSITNGSATPTGIRIEYINSSNVLSTPAVTVSDNESGIVTWLENIDIHTTLDLLGFIPVVGDAADLINAGIYLLEGDVANASISAAGFVIDGATALRTAGAVAGGVVVIGGTAYAIGKTATKELTQEGAEKAVKETVENATEQVVKNGADKVDDVEEELLDNVDKSPSEIAKSWQGQENIQG